MDFLTGVQAGGDEHVHDSSIATFDHPPHPHTPTPLQQTPHVFGFLFLVLGTFGVEGSGFKVYCCGCGDGNAHGVHVFE